MHRLYYPLLFATVLVAMVGALELGRRLGVRQRRAEPEGGDGAAGAIDGVVFALFGLLLAFTFSGAGTRFDHRRELVVSEANAIATAYARVDLLPADAQPEVRELYRGYVEARLATYRKLPDIRAFLAEYDRSVALHARIGTPPWPRRSGRTHRRSD